ncbi:MAG: hypothetical protein ACJ8FI_11065 [Sphingomicrobium sp.]|jgi:hypothetical protein
MTESHPQDYYRRRAEEERAAAEHANDERAAQSHRELSDQYEKLATSDDRPSGDDQQRDEPGIASKEFRIVP